jgi:hypothetical protein
MLNNKEMLYFKNALKDVAENSDFKHYKNTSKFVKKYSKVKENLSKLMLLIKKQKMFRKK